MSETPNGTGWGSVDPSSPSGQPTPPGNPPPGAAYGAPPPAGPYGAPGGGGSGEAAGYPTSYPAPQYGQPPYGTPGSPPGYPAPGYPPYGYPPTASAPMSASTIVLTVISGVLSLSCYFTLAGVPALILAIIALTRNNADPAGARKLTKIGWIVLGSVSAVIVLVLAVIIVIAASRSSSSGY